jgi:hypothetical protein
VFVGKCNLFLNLITECMPGKFGAHCSKRCGWCKNDETCHHRTGLCQGGCKAGFYGDNCSIRKFHYWLLAVCKFGITAAYISFTAGYLLFVILG